MALKDAGFSVTIATENGKTPECDAKMLEGITQKLLVPRSNRKQHKTRPRLKR
jgi:hypothetical protein